MKILNLKINVKMIFLAFCFSMISCNQTDKEKLDSILDSDEVNIQVNFYGGYVGYFEKQYIYKKKEFVNILIENPGTDFQKYINVDETKFKDFIIESFVTNNPNKGMSNSCMTGVDNEYIITTGFTKLVFRPSEKCDSLFYNLEIK